MLTKPPEETLIRDPKFNFVLTDPARLLVIDDDPIWCEFATVYLSSPNTKVDTAPNGAEALRKLLNDKYDLALVDYEMPGANGIEFIRRVRADPELNDLPLIMVTGRDDMEAIDRAYGAGATSFATKPVNWRLLSYHLRFVLRAHRAGAA